MLTFAQFIIEEDWFSTRYGRTGGSDKEHLWAHHKNRVYISKEHSLRGSPAHANWFRKIKLPSSGSAFDDVKRGYIQTHHASKTLHVRGYTGYAADKPHWTPNEVVHEFKRQNPKCKDYKVNDVNTPYMEKVA